ncbi:uncharacterized protein L969DRAFT_76060 [Mixia osmundae IAM 14324]|uniref:WW domain-containing protein n=1 Tax=Mixia osmundae (strain CBS 9802 / IAM 14324 / JCM 22182 / KY 12970) TaxID=764103 RepID=G7E6P4_MIXOS|nr:uncharacterized protein L969DRAFT_76060 [Mixia osmundae IAM 14324]KEI39114.1 hypothetical protein L969DRAFT_76060 [Mixia osmundae IAM 14324]GAA98504.1 hypothetical protein E5Q_05190 [Mixia osmundae IAM 14324]
MLGLFLILLGLLLGVAASLEKADFCLAFRCYATCQGSYSDGTQTDVSFVKAAEVTPSAFRLSLEYGGKQGQENVVCKAEGLQYAPQCTLRGARMTPDSADFVVEALQILPSRTSSTSDRLSTAEHISRRHPTMAKGVPEVAPGEAPPAYEASNGSSSLAPALSSSMTASTSNDGHTTDEEDNSTIAGYESVVPLERRASMEDELRELPKGWIRQMDSKSGHHFYVDTKANPPRSIWTHPYDDPVYLQSLPDTERHSVPTAGPQPVRKRAPAQGSSKQASSSKQAEPAYDPNRKRGLGEKIKDKVTNSTHAEREAKRKAARKREAELYEAHRQRRLKMIEQQRAQEQEYYKAVREGRAPPQQQGGYYDPYYSGGRYAAPGDPYYRRSGYGYGGGYGRGYGGGMGMGGMGMGMPLMGGMAGGLLLGSLLPPDRLYALPDYLNSSQRHPCLVGSV